MLSELLDATFAISQITQRSANIPPYVTMLGDATIATLYRIQQAINADMSEYVIAQSDAKRIAAKLQSLAIPYAPTMDDVYTYLDSILPAHLSLTDCDLLYWLMGLCMDHGPSAYAYILRSNLITLQSDFGCDQSGQVLYLA